MKKLFVVIILTIVAVQFSWANWPVSTEPQPRNVVLEEFTGIYCGFCPEGHIIGQTIKDNNPGRVVLINIHTGGYAVPQSGSGHPDFRTPWGDAIGAMSNLRGYPAGQVNRQLFEGAAYSQQQAGALALSRGGWEAASNVILSDANSPVNIGAKVERVGGTTLEITVELYYTSDPGQKNLLNVALLESGYIGYQGGSKGSDEYEHNHILRDLVTGQWGVLIDNIETGSKIERTFTYEITDRVDALGSDLQLAVFVSQQDHKHIYTGIEIDVPSIEPNAVLTSDDASLQPITKNETVEKTVTLENISDSELTFDLSLVSQSEIPSGWTYDFIEEGISPLTLQPGESKEIIYSITSNNTPGIFEMQFVALETNTELKLSYNDDLKCITSDAEYYLVDLEAEKQYSVADYIYNVGYEDFFEIDSDEFKAIGSFLSNVNTLVYDCGVDYGPTTADMSVINSLMNNNANIMIMGNRVLSDLSNINGLGYFGTSYNGYSLEGYGSAPYRVWLSGIQGDPITNLLGTNFEGNLINWLISLVEITDETTTTPILHFENDCQTVIYNSSTQARDTFDIKASDAIFGVKVDKGTSKHVLLGLTPYVIVNENHRKTLLREALNWMHGLTDVEEETVRNENVNIWPNPVKTDANISFEVTSMLSELVSIKLINSIGETVKEMPGEYLSKGNYSRNMNIESLPAGSYHLIVSMNGHIKTKKMIIVK